MSPVAARSASSQTAEALEAASLPNTDATLTLKEPDVPLVALPVVRAWAPLNLLLAALGACSSLAVAGRYLHHRARASAEAHPWHRIRARRSLALTVAVIGLAALGVFLLAFTQSFAALPVPVDRWTVPQTLLVLTQAALMVALRMQEGQRPTRPTPAVRSASARELLFRIEG